MPLKERCGACAMLKLPVDQLMVPCRAALRRIRTKSLTAAREDGGRRGHNDRYVTGQRISPKVLGHGI